jgi:hypothetical protein
MVEPIRVPSAPTSILSMSNITGAPLVTISSVLAAVAQYLAVNGAALPQDTNGWVSFGIGLAMAIMGALARGPQAAKVATVLVALWCATTIGACKSTSVTPSSQSAQVISALVQGAASMGCRLIPPTDIPAVKLGLQAFIGLLSTNPTQAIADAENRDSALNTNLGMKWVWDAIHSQLDPIWATGWSAYGVGLLKQATTACLQAIS